MGFLNKLKKGMDKTKKSLDEKVNNVFSVFRKVDEELLNELEEVLITSDVGSDASSQIIANLRDEVKKNNIKDEEEVREALRNEIARLLESDKRELKLDTTPSVLLFIGVNGAGKTTSIGKIANNLKNKGKKVLVVAADTFRAAAVEQLEEWTNRAGVDIVKKEEGSDPASVVYEGIKKAQKEDYDVLIIDTAGRLHNKKYLMEELNKIQRVIKKELPKASEEVLLVLDGTIGQNAIFQTEQFNKTAPITGLVVTKLDGTAKGGVVIGISYQNRIPVKYIGVGEQLDDMEVFDPVEYASSII